MYLPTRLARYGSRAIEGILLAISVIGPAHAAYASATTSAALGVIVVAIATIVIAAASVAFVIY